MFKHTAHVMSQKYKKKQIEEKKIKSCVWILDNYIIISIQYSIYVHETNIDSCAH